jgi:DnaK suppressor protein
MPTKKPAAKSAKSSKPIAPARKVVAHKAVTHKADAHKLADHKQLEKSPPKSASRPALKAAPVKAARPKPATAIKPVVKPSPVVKATPKTELARPQTVPVAVPAPPKKPIRRMPNPEEIVAVATASRATRPATEAADGEDLDGDMNLLAGPRNVTPYIAQRGEQYMSKEQLEHFREILGTWKTDLMREVDRTVSHMKDEAANFPDPNDRATQEEEFSLELRTRDRERKLIRKIDEALQRIEDGSYGYCLETGEEIGIKRLEARPVATLSLEAQERRERREKQYGDRDDRYR